MAQLLNHAAYYHKHFSEQSFPPTWIFRLFCSYVFTYTLRIFVLYSQIHLWNKERFKCITFLFRYSYNILSYLKSLGKSLPFGYDYFLLMTDASAGIFQKYCCRTPNKGEKRQKTWREWGRFNPVHTERGVGCGGSSIKKKLVIKWFRELNVTVWWSGETERKKKRDMAGITLSWDYSIY